MDRRTYISSLFTGADQRRNFQTLDAVFPVARMPASSTPFVFPRGPAITLPATYTHEGATLSVEALLDETETMALLVVRDGSIVFERYADWGGPHRRLSLIHI